MGQVGKETMMEADMDIVMWKDKNVRINVLFKYLLKKMMRTRSQTTVICIISTFLLP